MVIISSRFLSAGFRFTKSTDEIKTIPTANAAFPSFVTNNFMFINYSPKDNTETNDCATNNL